MTATIAIKDQITPSMRKGLEALPELHLLTGAPASVLLLEDAVLPLEVRHVAPTEIDDQAAPDPIAGHALLLIVEGVLHERDALMLEDQGVGFVDMSGRAWSPGLRRSTEPIKRRRRSAPLAIRAAQLLADHPDEEWAETKLAARAMVSAGTAHNLLRRLADSGFVERSGRGRGRRGAIITDRRGLRRWLVQQSARESPHRVPCFVRNVERIPAELDGVPLIRSGSAGALLLGIPVMSTTARTLLRVPVTPAQLEEIPSALGGVRADKAPNVLLVADTDNLASTDMRQADEGLYRAPASRIAMDLRLEPRGPSAGAVFLDLWGDSIL